MSVELSLHSVSGRARSLPGVPYWHSLTLNCLEPGESSVALRSHVIPRSGYNDVSGIQGSRDRIPADLSWGIPKPDAFCLRCILPNPSQLFGACFQGESCGVGF